MYGAATCSAYAYCNGTSSSSSCGAWQLWTGREALWSTLLNEATLCSPQSSLSSGSYSQLALSPPHYKYYPYGSYARSQLYAYPTLPHQPAAGAEFQAPTRTQATAPPAARAVMPTGTGIGSGTGGRPPLAAGATRSTARKERRRTANLNAAFAKLRARIPNMPPDTKLPKIKTLRRAADYIRYLSGLLQVPLLPPSPSRTASASETVSGHQVSDEASDVTLCAAGTESDQTLEQRSVVLQSPPTATKTTAASPTLALPTGSFLAQLEDSSDSAMWPFFGAVDAVLWQTTDQLQSAQTEVLLPTKSGCVTSEQQAQGAANCSQEAMRRTGGWQRSGWPEAMWKQSLDGAGAALPSGSPPSASASLPVLPCGRPSPNLPTAAAGRHAYEFEQLS